MYIYFRKLQTASGFILYTLLRFVINHLNLSPLQSEPSGAENRAAQTFFFGLRLF